MSKDFRGAKDFRWQESVFLHAWYYSCEWLMKLFRYLFNKKTIETSDEKQVIPNKH